MSVSYGTSSSYASKYVDTLGIVTSNLKLLYDSTKQSIGLVPNMSNPRLNNGILYNGANFANNLIVLDGTNDYIDVGVPSLITLTSQMTIEAYINASSFNTDTALFTRGGLVNNNNRDWRIQLGSFWTGTPGRWGFEISSSKVMEQDANANYLVANAWYHIALTFNSGNASMYMNGTYLKSNAVAATLPSTAGYSMNIGKGSGGAQHYYKGSIGIVQVYDRALSGSEISQNFNALRSRYGL